jgi:alpha-mannosidase
VSLSTRARTAFPFTLSRVQPPTQRQVGIVPHTHWDREWYAPFQAYRVELVHLVDDLLDLLDEDAGYSRFLLDGQTVVLDDYLEVRPDAERSVAKLAGEGRLQIGPWMVLMDEFMVSGETIVRDLQLGLERASDLFGRESASVLRADVVPHRWARW